MLSKTPALRWKAFTAVGEALKSLCNCVPEVAMDPKYYGLIEMGLTFGIVAVWTVQQLWSLRDKTPPDDDPPRGE